MTRPRFAGPALILAAALFALPTQAQQRGAIPADAADRYLEHVQERLDLSDTQKALVAEALEAPAPGVLWSAAAALAPTLSAEQQARLTTRPERRVRPDRADRPEGEARSRMPRGERPARRDRAERSDRDDTEANLEAMKSARNAALGLSATQAASLDRLAEEHRAERQERMQERRANRDDASRGAERPDAPHGPLPEAVAEILTAEQETVWLVHHALRPHHGPRGMRRGGARSPRD